MPHPFRAEPGARLYRTGDLARSLPGGDLEFLGRIDNQIKIRGFRIEPEEIEAALRRHPGVGAAAVAAHGDARNPASGGKRLIAYVVSRAEPPPAARELREFLSAALPDYMVPAAFVTLAALPLTASGKIDRRALPALAPDGPEPESAFAAPRSPLEARLAAIWAQVLQLERVGINDNFFALGGHSLLATQVISRVREAYRIELSLRALFDAPTVAGLAEIVRQAGANGAAGAAAKISRAPRVSGS